MSRPRLWEVLRAGYSWKTLGSDVTSGLIVGVVAIPLAVAFAIASGVTPDKGLLTAVIAGFLISALGGSNVQIGGPTGAFIVIVYGILSKYGVEGLLTATIMAGIFLLILGFARLGSIVQFIPYPVIVGFTAGIALTILTSQVNDFLGLGLTHAPPDFLGKWTQFLTHLGQANPWAVGLAVGTVVAILILQRWVPRVPASLVVLIVASAVSVFAHLPVETIASRFGPIAASWPTLHWPDLQPAHLTSLIMPAVSIAGLAAIESLLSAVVSDAMSGTKHDSNQELIGQGAANLASALLGGIPATGAIARTATNVKSGGKTPVAGLIHAALLLGVLIFLSPLTGMIPMSVLAGILVIVCVNMSEHRAVRYLIRGPRGDLIVLIVTFLLTALIDLTVAIPAGILFSLLAFLRKMSTSGQVRIARGHLQDTPPEQDPFGLTRLELPDGVEVIDIEGPLFFGAAERFKESLETEGEPPRVRIVRCRHVPNIDASGVLVLSEVLKKGRKTHSALLLAAVQPAVRRTLDKIGFTGDLGEDCFLADITSALDKARVILGQHEASVPNALRRGGTVLVEADNPREVLIDGAAAFPVTEALRSQLLESIREREAMASTGLGRGVAFPHPRAPLLGGDEPHFVTVAYCAQPVDWGSVDGEPVHTVFFVAASSVAAHLKLVSALAKAVKNPEFEELLCSRASADALAAWMET